MSGRKILKNNSAWEETEDHPNNLGLKVIVKTPRNSTYTYILIFELKLAVPNEKGFSISVRYLEKIPGSRSGLGWIGVSKYKIRFFGISFTLRYIRVFLCISGYFWVYWISSLFLEVVSKILTTNHYPSLSWCFTWNTKLCLGTPEISGDSRYPMIFKTEWGWLGGFGKNTG